MEQPRINILYVDNLEGQKLFTKIYKAKYGVYLAETRAEAFEVLKTSNDIHVLISNLGKDQSGTDFLSEVKSAFPRVLRILVTSDFDPEILKDAINKMNIFKCVESPLDTHEMNSALNEAFELHQKRKEGSETIRKLIDANTDFTEKIREKQEIAKLILGCYYNQN